MGRGIVIVLAVSLGLNFLIAGYLLNDVMDGDRASPPHAAEFRGFNNPRGLVGAANVLPQESRRDFRAAFRERLPDMRAHHREMRVLRRDMKTLIAADEWDGAAVSEKMKDIRDVRARQQRAFDEAFLAALTTLSSEDRDRLLEFAEQRRRERPGRRRFGPPPDRPE